MGEGFNVDWRPSRPLLLTQQQTAAWLNVSDRTVRNLIRKGKLPVRFIGRRCLIPAAAVEKFAAETAKIEKDSTAPEAPKRRKGGAK